MDTTTLFLFEKIRRNEGFEYIELFNFLILIPLLTYILNNGNKYLGDITGYFKNKLSRFYSQKNEITLIATETLDKDGSTFYNYTKPILSLCHRIKSKKIKINFKHIKSNMGIGKDFVIQYCENLQIDNDLYLDVFQEQNEESKKANQTVFKYILKSKERDIEIFLDECIEEYTASNQQIHANKLYHFVYTGNDRFQRHLISDLKNNPNLETFDKIYNEHSSGIQKDILRLKNLDYYKRTGLKRKKGYLFYGEPGCGKTSTVMAMANFDKRHIVEVPLSRVKTNQEIEDILNLNNEWFDDIHKNEVIILFDEIDCNLNKIESRSMSESGDSNDELKTMINNLSNTIKKEECTVVSLTEKSSSLDLGTILSRLDGIGNYNGLIIVATTNNKDSLDPALYRELRLTPIHFDYARKEDMINMIEDFYEIKLKDNEKIKIPDRNARISPAKFRCMLEKYEDNYKELLFNVLK